MYFITIPWGRLCRLIDWLLCPSTFPTHNWLNPWPLPTNLFPHLPGNKQKCPIYTLEPIFKYPGGPSFVFAWKRCRVNGPWFSSATCSRSERFVHVFTPAHFPPDPWERGTWSMQSLTGHSEANHCEKSAELTQDFSASPPPPHPPPPSDPDRISTYCTCYRVSAVKKKNQPEWKCLVDQTSMYLP